MPELIEVEAYRLAALPTLGRTIASVELLDPNFLKRVPPQLFADIVVGARIDALRRIGKLLLIDTSKEATIGLRFGMTGRLVVDGAAPIDRLVYGANTGDAKWDRFALMFTTGSLVIHDPRRLGSVELDPDESALGPDAATITSDRLGMALRGTRVPLKARLMDQAKIAGLGNLLTDEILWRAGLDPFRPGQDVSSDEVDGLATVIVATIAELTNRGGSHTGDLQAQRDIGPATVGTSVTGGHHVAGYCPIDGEPLRRDQLGGRTTVWCPAHQR